MTDPRLLTLLLATVLQDASSRKVNEQNTRPFFDISPTPVTKPDWLKLRTNHAPQRIPPIAPQYKKGR